MKSFLKSCLLEYKFCYDKKTLKIGRNKFASDKKTPKNVLTKFGSEAKRLEAKSEALFEASFSDLGDLSEALAVQLGRHDTLELIKHLLSRVQNF